MKIFGICMVRNEADVIRLSLLHQLALGLDRILIIDNGSTDGTVEVLECLSRDDPRIQWHPEPDPYQQSAALTALAREALRQGADWVVPFDADEFWWVRSGSLRTLLAETPAGALRAPLVNFIQRRDQVVATEPGLLSMTRRVPWAVRVHPRRVEARHFAYVEAQIPAKWLFQPAAEVVVAQGNHKVTWGPEPSEAGYGLAILHAPLRSRADLERKADHGERALASGSPPEISWHLKRWARLRVADGLDAEWAANSYVGTSLDVYGQARSLIVDRRLRDAVAPFLPETERGAGHDRRPRAASGIVQHRRSYRRPWPPAVTSAPAIQPVIAGSAGNAVPTPLPSLHPASDRSAHAHDDPWRPQTLRVEGANQGTITFLESTSCRVIAEVGIYEGHTSRHIAEFLAGEGELHLFDFSDRVDEVVAQLNEAGHHNVVGHGNSRKLLDSYNWSLMRVLQNNSAPLYDYVFLDGAHVWALDALAFFLIDRLLKPGGYIDFDDYGWSISISPSLNPIAFPVTSEMYTPEQIQEQQVALVIDLLVRRDPRYVEVVKNKVFQKLR
jgi:hypothetical protein